MDTAGSSARAQTGFSLALAPAPSDAARPSFLSLGADLPPPTERRVDEMDFFSEERTRAARPPLLRKTEDLTLHMTGLQLQIAATGGGDISRGEDGEKRKMNEVMKLKAMQTELKKLEKENKHLRDVLGKVSEDYNALHIHYTSLVQQRGLDVHADAGRPATARQFLELGPGVERDELSNSSNETASPHMSGSPHGEAADACRSRIMSPPLDLPLDLPRIRVRDREGSPEISWMSNKLPKLTSTRNPPVVVQQPEGTTQRKARVAVRALSDAAMISDGCQWRKYGQKMAKGNPCPRAYYRCTMVSSCPVRKQVQRCAENKAVLITTYEGSHNHALPPAAQAMAATTSTAASMLLSGSMPSVDGGLLDPNFLARSLFQDGSTFPTISASAPYPTVTMDLTHIPLLSQQQCNRIPQGSQFPVPAAVPHIFGQALYSNQSQFSGLQSSSSSSTHEEALSKAMFSNPTPVQQPVQQPSLSDINAATTAIMSDPNFAALLAAAYTSLREVEAKPPSSICNPPTNNNSNNSS